MKFKILKSREAQIGLLIAVILALFIWGFNFLKGRNILKPANYYHCVFEDVGGLIESNFTMVRGYKVGIVKNIRLSKDNQNLIVTLVLEEERLKVTKGSKAVLYNLDLLGTKAIKLELAPGTNYYLPGDTIPSMVQKDMVTSLQDEIKPLQTKISSIVSALDSVMGSINKAFNDTAIQNIKGTIANLNITTASLSHLLKDKSSPLNKTMANLTEITEALNDEETGIKPTLKNINSISDSLASADFKRTLGRIDSTIAGLNSVITKIDSNEGSLGSLVHDKTLYDNLANSTEALTILLEDLQKQPSKYVQLSLIDWGKDVYIDEDGISRKVGSDTYFSLLVKSVSNPLPINSENFVEPTLINEHKQKDTFYYYTGKYSTYSAAMKALKELQNSYPSAEVVAFKKGKITPLEKLLK